MWSRRGASSRFLASGEEDVVEVSQRRRGRGFAQNKAIPLPVFNNIARLLVFSRVLHRNAEALLATKKTRTDAVDEAAAPRAAQAERVRGAASSERGSDAAESTAGEQPVVCDRSGTIAPAHAAQTPTGPTGAQDWAAFVDTGFLCEGPGAGVRAANSADSAARSASAEGFKRQAQVRQREPSSC